MILKSLLGSQIPCTIVHHKQVITEGRRLATEGELMDATVYHFIRGRRFVKTYHLQPEYTQDIPTVKNFTARRKAAKVAKKSRQFETARRKKYSVSE